MRVDLRGEANHALAGGATMRHIHLTRAACAAALLALAPGCLSVCHPVEAPPPADIFPCHEVPQACKNRVHVFFLHGLDPLDFANFQGVHDYVRSLGFLKTYFGLPFHAFHFEKELRRVHEADPEARFVLVGFSYGAGLVRDIACTVQKAGIAIDLVVYMDGVRLEQRDLHRPANVGRVINVLAFDRSADSNVAEAENHVLEGVWHFGMPSHPQVLRLLGRELGELAAQVPFVQYGAGMPGGPVRAVPLPQRENETWGFLRPDEHAKGAEAPAPTADASAAPPAREAVSR